MSDAPSPQRVPRAGGPAPGPLVARGVSVQRGTRRVVHDVDLTLRRGEVLGLVGANGAGKSSLLTAIAGDLPFTGSVTLGGFDVGAHDLAGLARVRAVMAQHTAVPFAFRVHELVALGRLPFTESPTARDAAVARAIDAVDLTPLRDRPHHALSGGELRRVHLARLLAQADGIGPGAVLLVDEPTAGLDLKHAMQALALLRRRADAGGAVIVVLHDLHLAGRFCDRLALLHRGRCIACDTPDAIIRPDLLEVAWGTPMRVHRTDDGERIAWAAPLPSTPTLDPTTPDLS